MVKEGLGEGVGQIIGDLGSGDGVDAGGLENTL